MIFTSFVLLLLLLLMLRVMAASVQNPTPYDDPNGSHHCDCARWGNLTGPSLSHLDCLQFRSKTQLSGCT